MAYRRRQTRNMITIGHRLARARREVSAAPEYTEGWRLSWN